MKHNKLFSDCFAGILSVIIAIAGLVCLTTGFNLENVNWITVFLACCIAAVLSVFSFRSLKVLLVTGACVLILLWFSLGRNGTLLQSLEALLYRITIIYDKGYGWGYIRWSKKDLIGVSLTPVMILMGCMIVATVCFTVCRRKWFGFGAIAGLLPLLLCCVVTDTVPAAIALLVLVMALLMLLLTQLSRRQNEFNGNRLTAILLIPVLLFSMVTFGFAQTYPYEEQAAQLQAWFLDLISEDSPPPSGPGTGSVTGTVVTEKIDLKNVGPLKEGTNAELYVTANSTGVLYLRGRSYDLYSGTGWESTAATAGEGGWPVSGLVGNTSIRIGLTSSNPRYFAYYPLDSNWTDQLMGGMLQDLSGDRNYMLSIGKPGNEVIFTPLSAHERTQYLELPEDTQQAALDILAQLLSDTELTVPEIAAIIAEYVMNSASYDLDTERMPSDATDFAIWFLEESDTGYCTHFASAATVLLRAAGVPARYVTGYALYARSNVTVKVSGKQAHAWVEYLHPQQGWTMLEVTPEDPDDPVVPPTVDPTETTGPEDTDPTEITAPTMPTLPPTPSDPTTQPTTETTEPETTLSTTPGTGPGTGSVEPKLDLTWLKYVGAALAICALLIWQHGLRKKLRRKRLNKGTPNQQALRRWRYVRRAARRIKQLPPEELQALAEKAAFSQHTLTAQELHQFDRWLRDIKEAMLQRNWLIRLLLKLIYAL